MILLGLTGKTGAGKSEVAKVLASRGIAHIDCDCVSREVETPGSPCLQELVAYFGGGILRQDGSLDRRALAAIAFSDPARLSALSGITHKYILERVDEYIAKYEREGCKAVCLDAAALLESGLDRRCNAVCVVTAPREVRLARILRRDEGLTRAAALRRIDAQRDDAYYLSRADYVIENNGDIGHLRSKASALVSELMGERR